jgi:hypothetical protein
MRLTLIAAAVLLGAAAPPAATPADTAAAPDQTTPAQDAAQDMMLIYEDICLGHFPNPASVRAAVADAQGIALKDADAREALLGHAGTAWAVNAPHGRVVVAVDTPPSRTCVVTGPAAEDDGVRAVFDLTVTSTAKTRDYGTLVKPPVRQGNVRGHAATIQLIGTATGGGRRQAFINMGVANADGSTQLRLTREVAP